MLTFLKSDVLAARNYDLQQYNSLLLHLAVAYYYIMHMLYQTYKNHCQNHLDILFLVC